MTTSTTNRRALLRLAVYAGGAAVVATAAGIGEAVTSAHGAERQTVSHELVALIAAARAANAKSNTYHSDVYEPAKERFSEIYDGIPHIEIDGMPSYDGGATVWSTADELRVKNATVMGKRRVSFSGPGSENARLHHMKMRKLAAAGKWRERAITKARLDSGMTAAYANLQVLEDEFSDAEHEMEQFPAATIYDLAAKIEYLRELGSEEDGYAAKIYVADIDRLTKRGR